MRLHYRPFGAWGSLAEVAFGIWLIQSTLWAGEDYRHLFAFALASVGGVVALAGVLGLFIAARGALASRSDTESRDVLDRRYG